MIYKPAFIYANYLPTAAVTATDTATGFDPADVLEPVEDTGWKPTDVSEPKSLTIDLGVSVPWGCLAILGEYLNGVTLQVLASTDDFVGSSVEVSAAAVINTGTFVSTWRSFTERNERYCRLIFSDMGASFEIHHVAICRYDQLPYLNDGHDPSVIQATGTHMISQAGYYLGSNHQRTMKPLSLDFGQTTAAQFVKLQRWADVCVNKMQPFFYVPDTGLPECWFGWLDEKYKFAAPSKEGARRIAPIPFTTRVA